jgi:hypothetical protein
MAATLLTVCSLALVGCTFPESASQPAATGPASPEPTSTETSAPVDVTDPATWVISVAGVGPFQIGADLKFLEATLPGLALDTTVPCPNPNAKWFKAGSSYVVVFDDETGKIGGVNVIPRSLDPSGIVDISHTLVKSPHTPLGVGLGSTLTQLIAESPSAAKTGYGEAGYEPDAPMWTVETSAAWITFSFATDTQTIGSIGVWNESLPPYDYCG